jgi:NACHT domain
MVNDVWLWLLAQSPPSNATSSPTNQLLDWLTSNSMIGWGIATAIAKLTGNLDTIIGFINKYRRKKRQITDEDRQKLRQQLIEVVLRQVIKRLEDSLHHKIRLDLKHEEERQRVGRRDSPSMPNSASADPFIHREINPFDTPSAPTPVVANISTAALIARDDIKGRLLILGEPGAGKTNELLVLTKALLQQAQQSVDQPIPVIFELSEWSGGQEKPFSAWLIEQLQEKYKVPAEVSEQWIRQNQLLPLLDGLDELRRVDDVESATSEEIDQKRQAKQVQCMRTINAFLDMHASMSMVVCCRRKEYEALEAQGEYLKGLNGAIYLQKLDDEQIQRYLEPIRKPGLPLRQYTHKLDGSSQDSFLHVSPNELTTVEIGSSMSVCVLQPIVLLCSWECHQ